MPRLPDYTALGSVSPNAGRAIASVDTSAVNEATARLGNAITQSTQEYAGAVQKENEKQAKIDYAFGKAYYVQQITALQQQFKDDPDYATQPQRFAEAEKKIREKTLGSITDPYYSKLFEADAAEYSQKGLFSIQDKAAEKGKEYGKASLLENLDKLSKTAGVPQPQKQSDINIQTAQDAINAAVDAGFINPIEAVKMRQSFTEQYATDYYKALPPQQVLAVLKGGQAQGGFDNAVATVLKHEGGYNASDGNTGSPVNFGINQKANPDIDVKNLTQEQAKAIYKERYWDKYGLDSVPADAQSVVFDGVVNHGSVFAQRLVDAAKQGVPRSQLIQMRQQEYDRLARNEKYAPYKNTWDSRLDTFRTEDAQSSLVNFLPVDKRQGLERDALVQLEKQETERKALEKETNTAVKDAYLARAYDNNGKMSEFTSDEIRDMKERGIYDDVAKFKGITDENAWFALNTMDANEKKNIDPREWRDKLSRSDFESLTKEVVALQKDEKLAFRKNDQKTLIDNVATQLGFDPTGATNDADSKRKYNAFKGVAEQAIVDFEFRTGKPPSSEDTRKILSDLAFKKGSTPTFSVIVPANGAPKVGGFISLRQAAQSFGLTDPQDIQEFINNPAEKIKPLGLGKKYGASKSDINAIIEDILAVNGDATPENVEAILAARASAAATAATNTNAFLFGGGILP